MSAERRSTPGNGTNAVSPRRHTAPRPERDEGADNAVLFRRLRQGDATAFDAIVERYWAATFRYADALLNDRDLAADIAQETFLRLWRHRERIEPSQPPRPWLFRAARNLSLNQQRNRRVRVRWAERQSRAPPAGPSTPEEDTERSELLDALDAAIRRLPARRREVFTLFHLQKLSYGEISEIMGIRPRSIANHLQAALADLREALEMHRPGSSERHPPRS